MNPTIKKQWIDALRSGKYKQGKYHLYDEVDNTYCCLGVLCKIIYPTKDIRDLSQYGKEEVPSDDIVNISGLFRNNPITPRGSLAYLNDSGKSFNEIADIIEEYL